ncbi:branched-chain amino acid aminotransferase [Actinosynnema sp. NPDC047251]|uniref:Branched-chain-amino-acid aminotransferase n=1 Tax=Saccharothrix espanaensis (strain ATCC 51144 / DSM 44229 / JCM 9112 / NBRC 15066 / NRRL 15764) TaxID=1179773 RepID=K0K684_SACES|nr:branched-chain amino acid aminotransferase [Saccharothrix espanaensis]CCH32058.1 Branched-chain amino acid aminotransferase [Saccharothrix espanaensis DSM 44229]
MGIAWSRTVLADERRLSAAELARRVAAPGFGEVTTEHVVSCRWSAEREWHDAEVLPYQPVPMDPAMAGLHYGQVVFEGLKAYRQPDGAVAAFRAVEHAERFRRSAARLAMPEPPVELFLESLAELVAADRRWVPADDSQSLYLRPVLYGTDASLALRPAAGYRLLVLALVVENFFGTDAPPVSVWAGSRYARASVGGTGEAKCAGNYAGAFAAQVEAAEHGCRQVVWLDAAEHRWVEEMGAMNIFFCYGDRLVTPPLSGTLLPGITRASVLALAADLGLTVEERRVSLADWRADATSGAMTEAFACGTAAVVTPIGRVVERDGGFAVGTGPVAGRLLAALTDVQRGRVEDVRGWRYRLAE